MRSMMYGILRNDASISALEALADVETRFGDAYYRFGDFDRALQHQDKAIALYKKIFSERSLDADKRRGLLLVQMRAGDAAGRTFHSRPGDLKAARAYYKPARSTAEELAAADPSNKIAVVDVISLLRREGLSYQFSDPSRGVPLLRKAVMLAEQLVTAVPDNTLFRQQHLYAQSNLAALLTEARQFRAAVSERRKMIGIAEDLHRLASQSMRYFLDAVSARTHLANALCKVGSFNQAEQLYREAIARCRDPKNQWIREELVRVENADASQKLGQLLAAKRTSKAAGCSELRNAEQLWGSLASEFPTHLDYVSRRGTVAQLLSTNCR